MRYYHEYKQTRRINNYGSTYKCNHVVYNKCTLYLIGNKGLAVIQQRYDWKTKRTWWGEIDDELINEIFLNSKFKDYFNSHAGEIKNNLYPTVTVRQLMWGLKMKPIKREAWETVFDKCCF